MTVHVHYIQFRLYEVLTNLSITLFSPSKTDPISYDGKFLYGAIKCLLRLRK